MWEIYGYCRKVALKGMGEDKIKAQEAVKLLDELLDRGIKGSYTEYGCH